MDERGAVLLGQPDLKQLCALPVTGAALLALERFDPKLLADDERVLYLRAVQRAESHFAGRRLETVAELAREVDETGKTLAQAATVAEVGIALRLAPGSAVNEIHRAHRLVTHLPRVLAGMAAGELTYCHGLALLDATRSVDDPQVLAEVQDRVLVKAASKSPGQLAGAARRLVARLDPDAFERRHAAVRRQADVTMCPAEDAMAYLSAYLPLPDAVQIRDQLENYARARKAAGDQRSLGLLRCEALLSACTSPGALHPPRTSGAGNGTRNRRSRSHGRPVELQIVATPQTLLGLCNLPGEIAGVGSVPASVIRQMARDAKLRWLTIDEQDGRLLDHGVKTYRVPARMAAAVNATWVTSVGPHSTVPATRCDVDHILRYPDGPTAECNLAPEDRRTHVTKTRTGLKLTRRPDGLLVWTTPLGQTLTVEPFDYRLGP